MRAFDAALAASEGDEQKALSWLDTLYKAHVSADMANNDAMPSLTAEAVHESFVRAFSQSDWVGGGGGGRKGLWSRRWP